MTTTNRDHTAYTFGGTVDLGYQGTGREVVHADGTVLGVVYKSTRTWERRSPGKRYVNARGETPCWRVVGAPYWSDYRTRREAAEELVWQHIHQRNG